ncbi:hypothetical protein J2J97_32235 (plasmid) [Rhizobium bangladeshense]|uniref:hypothetical protein n=1 Tax=Rhizobium bangladeshense TaxID=1138189 RepID=UPI001A998DDC|nr:hypothetical protein [Rhizobium bangladeshense]QSY98575.1 hypothetical protein J2J97_32235 [Rhizobium bangladeshense]
MSAIALHIATMPRSSHNESQETVYVPRPVTDADRQLGLYVMIGSLVGMVLLGAWVLYRRRP